MSNIEEDIELLKKLDTTGDEEFTQAIKNILAERKQDKARIKELEEYIAVAPNLDEMTATKYVSIQREAYVKGRAEEQQKAEEIINNNYIPKQKVKDKIEELRNDIKNDNCRYPYILEHKIDILLELLEDK